ncbi:MAG TPA: hypothetical protein VG838_03035 [Opitutaceae bacterium]|nr:hypothetical protein [Opitutaceae bacterium]
MKTKLFATLLLSAATLGAAPLTETTAVHSRPDAMTPAITYLKAGTEPVATADSLATAPAGWMAIELPGPFEGYVRNDDMTKALDVRPGAEILIEPKADAAVLTHVEKGDKIEIAGLLAKWVQVHLDKKIIGYIRLAPESLPAVATTPAGLTDSAPLSVTAMDNGAAGRPAAPVDLGDGGAAAVPRLFQGKLVSTRRPFTPRRPYDYQLNDDAGARLAYLDFSKLLQTEQIDKYAGHIVVVNGTARNVPEAKGIVIQVESLELK